MTPVSHRRRSPLVMLLPLLAIPVGFADAFAAFQVHSVFFALLPVLAFALGYYANRRWGALSGFFLYAGYTVAVTLVQRGRLFEPYDLLYNFALGGFMLCIVGGLAPALRKGLRNLAGGAAIAVLALAVVWCGIRSVPRNSYYYQVIVESSQDVSNVRLYLPVGATDDGPYAALFGHRLTASGGQLTRDFSSELVETEFGRMLKLDIPRLQKKPGPARPAPEQGMPPPPITSGPTPPGYNYAYIGNVIFSQAKVSGDRLRLTARSEVKAVDIPLSERFLGPVRSVRSRVIEQFRAPVKVMADSEAEVVMRLENRSDAGAGISFFSGRLQSYSETVRLVGATADRWVRVDGQTVSSKQVTGGD